MAEQTSVTVETDDEPDNAPDVVVAPVIVTGGEDSVEDTGVSADLAMTVGALAATVAALSEKVDNLSAQQSVTETTAEAAFEVAQVAVTEVQEVAEETEGDIEPDNEPNNLPWTHRRLFGRNS